MEVVKIVPRCCLNFLAQDGFLKLCLHCVGVFPPGDVKVPFHVKADTHSVCAIGGMLSR